MIQIKSWKKKKDWGSCKKIPDTSKFIVTQNFNRLTKIYFNARMEEALQNLAIKKQVNKFDLWDEIEKNSENFKVLI